VDSPGSYYFGLTSDSEEDAPEGTYQITALF